MLGAVDYGMSSEAPRRALIAERRSIAILAAFALAGLLGSVEAAQVYIGMRNLGQEISWSVAVFSTLPSWLILATLLGPTALLFRRFPLDRRRLRKSVPVHLAAALLFTSVHLAATAFAAEQLLTPVGYDVRLGSLATMYFTLDVLCYTAVIGIFQLLRVYRSEIEQERATAELAASLSHARFHALRNQMEPHFLFNALNAINSLAMRGDRDEVMSTVSSLAALLRESLKDGSPQLVPLNVELQYVSNYLALQTIRFPNRVRVETLVSSDAGNSLVPALTLHTLIEEAVSSRLLTEGPCTLQLHGARAADHLHVDVLLEGGDCSDDTALDEPIRTLRSRLRRLYGNGYDLTRHSTDAGTAIRLRIPARTAAVV
jgi:two-component system, LytTR family, sensor kinase